MYSFGIDAMPRETREAEEGDTFAVCQIRGYSLPVFLDQEGKPTAVATVLAHKAMYIAKLPDRPLDGALKDLKIGSPVSYNELNYGEDRVTFSEGVYRQIHYLRGMHLTVGHYRPGEPVTANGPGGTDFFADPARTSRR
jgi:hypothetical protein